MAGEPVEVEIAAGSSAAQIGRLLAEAGVISSAPEFERAVRLQQVSDRLQAGTYDLETGMTVDAVIAALVEGPGGGVVRITLIEGLTVGAMLDSLAEQTGFERAVLEGALLDGSVTSDLLPDGARRPGRLGGAALPRHLRDLRERPSGQGAATARRHRRGAGGLDRLDLPDGRGA